MWESSGYLIFILKCKNSNWNTRRLVCFFMQLSNEVCFLRSVYVCMSHTSDGWPLTFWYTLHTHTPFLTAERRRSLTIWGLCFSSVCSRSSLLTSVLQRLSEPGIIPPRYCSRSLASGAAGALIISTRSRHLKLQSDLNQTLRGRRCRIWIGRRHWEAECHGDGAEQTQQREKQHVKSQTCHRLCIYIISL